MPLIASAVSLVAGNVTGGGGKATTTKTYWHQALRGAKQDVKTFWVLTGKFIRRVSFSEYKIGDD